MVQGMLVHAHMLNSYYHALTYMTFVFNVLPIKNLVDVDGKVATQYLSCLGSKPLINSF